MGRTFSLWWGSNDELRGERYPGLNGICDEALGFDAFHGFAGRLEFGFAFVSDRGQASGVRNVSIMHVLSEPTGSSSGAQMSGPPLNSGRPPTTMFGLPTAESIPRRASSQASAWGRNRRSVVHVPRGRGEDRPAKLSGDYRMLKREATEQSADVCVDLQLLRLFAPKLGRHRAATLVLVQS
jgi:hypothetical protein